jgi:hypothetical protein
MENTQAGAAGAPAFDPTAWLNKGAAVEAPVSPTPNATVAGQQHQAAPTVAQQIELNQIRAGHVKQADGTYAPPAGAQPAAAAAQPASPDGGAAAAAAPAPAKGGLVIDEQGIIELRKVIGKNDGELTVADISAAIAEREARLTAHNETLAAGGIFVNDTIKDIRATLALDDREFVKKMLGKSVPASSLDSVVDNIIVSNQLKATADGFRTELNTQLTTEETRLKSEHDARVQAALAQKTAPDVTAVTARYVAAAKDISTIAGVSLGKTPEEVSTVVGKAAAALADGSFARDVVGNDANMIQLALLWQSRETLGSVLTELGRQQGKAALLLEELGNVRPADQHGVVPVPGDGTFDPNKFRQRA